MTHYVLYQPIYPMHANIGLSSKIQQIVHTIRNGEVTVKIQHALLWYILNNLLSVYSIILLGANDNINLAEKLAVILPQIQYIQ